MSDQSIIETIVGSHSAAVIVPVATAAIAPITAIAEWQGYLSITSMLFGLAISALLMQHWRIKIKIAQLELEKLQNDS